MLAPAWCRHSKQESPASGLPQATAQDFALFRFGPEGNAALGAIPDAEMAEFAHEADFQGHNLPEWTLNEVKKKAAVDMTKADGGYTMECPWDPKLHGKVTKISGEAAQAVGFAPMVGQEKYMKKELPLPSRASQEGFMKRVKGTA